jgi:hypothetical protein
VCCLKLSHLRTSVRPLCCAAALLQRPVLPLEPSASRHWLWCPCVWVRLQAGVLSGAWYGFAVAHQRGAQEAIALVAGMEHCRLFSQHRFFKTRALQKTGGPEDTHRVGFTRWAWDWF